MAVADIQNSCKVTKEGDGSTYWAKSALSLGEGHVGQMAFVSEAHRKGCRCSAHHLFTSLRVTPLSFFVEAQRVVLVWGNCMDPACLHGLSASGVAETVA